MPLHKARLKISDYNETRKKRLGSQDRKMRMVSLSLTSMVDMFAILVIYLLTNSSSVSQWIEVGHKIELPRAQHAGDQPPAKSATLQINREGIFGEEKLIVTSAQLMGVTSSASIKGFLAKQKDKNGYVNIVADVNVPFGVIRRVITSCQEAGFGNVNLAVQPGKPAT